MALSHSSQRHWSAGGSPAYKLAGVKHTLYHPQLPTLRRMEMDSMAHKLSEEHSRNSTPCVPETFHQARFTTYGTAGHRLPSLDITDTGRQVTEHCRSGSMGQIPGVTREGCPSLTEAAVDWSRCVSSCGEFQLRDLKKHVLGYSGYAVRHLSPSVTSSWKYCLHQTPSLDQTGQRPLPVESLNTFRTFGSSYSRNTYMRPWH
ncbi:sperm microtubule inner protein 8 [Hyperolius riggenbachi]|uniref:sperm microtubule inner protein 8 n=1 Tax=Hyperolius riggenbachi TaxID=752182 RepID=UPI0035A34A50